jgi:hypothetical protein
MGGAFGYAFDMQPSPLAIAVSCTSGYRGEETPRQLIIAGRTRHVTQVLDRWLAPEHRYFKLRCDDGGIYILRHDVNANRWELTFFRQEAALADEEHHGS